MPMTRRGQGDSRRRRSERTQKPAPLAFVRVGQALAAWGVGGGVKVEVLTDFPDRFRPGARVYVGGVAREVEEATWHQGYVLLKLRGIDGREAAEALRGLYLEIPVSEVRPLPEGTYYGFQIVGLEVVTAAGEALGRVVDVLGTGANDVYVVHGPRGEVLLPAIAEVVREIDVAGGQMVVELPPGLM